ncbi:MAG: efflux RND transporter periplasmic adaptor subunit [Verrucomicrobiales bacterium]|nr:efflux RND transporter periplasmic adaptor subunit [Verrucomicrobiales bacterium]
MKLCCSLVSRAWTPALSGGLLALAALVSNGCQPGGGGGPPADPIMEVVIAQPVRQSVEDTLSAVGTVEANERVTIQPEVPGLIEAIRFAEGERVEQGQTLFRMESRTEAAAVLQAQAELRLARSNLERARTLVGSLAVSAQELDQLESLLDVKTALLKTEEERLAKRTLTAPFTGIVGPRLVSAGQYVGAGTPLVTLVDDAQVKVSCRLPERQSALVRLGQPARLRLAAWPDTTFTGRVDLLDAVVDPATRTLAVRVLAPNPDFRLKAGMFARVELVVQSRPESLVIPEAALVPSLEQFSVYQVQDGRAHLRPIQLGVRLPGLVEVRGGLTADTRIVVSGLQKLVDGIQVTNAPPVAAGPTLPAEQPRPAETSS